MATEVMTGVTRTEDDWEKPQAMAIPKEGYFKYEQGLYGPILPRTPACYGFSVVAKVLPGREQAIRDYGKNIGCGKGRSHCPRSAQAPLSSLGLIRCRLGDALHVSRDLRHRFR